MKGQARDITTTESLQLRKSVGAIHTSGSLTLVQRKLANVLLFNAYDQLVQRRTHTIPVAIMCTMLGWDGSNKMEHLKDALRSLTSTSIEFNLKEDGKDVWRVMSMLSFGEIKNGVCTYRYDEFLAERLYDPAIYAMINLHVQRKFDSGQALNLYENCLRFKNTGTGSTGWWSLPFLRSVIGATSSHYDDFRRLNAKAIKPAVEQVNRESDIVLTAEAKKEGRTVVSMRFLVREKTAEEQRQQQQAQLPGMAFTESIDEYADLRKTEAFLALKRHGIAERLAFAWIRDRGEQSVLDLVTYTEERDKSNKIKTTTGAYMRGLVTDGADIGPSAYEVKKQVESETAAEASQQAADAARLAELRDNYEREQTTKAVKSLSAEERTRLAMNFQAEAGQGSMMSWNADNADFTNSVERVRFLT